MGSIKVRFSQNYERRDVYFYALRAEVVSSEGIPPKIFVYHQFPPGVDGNTFSEFDHVASPVDFQEIPDDAASEIVPWFRTNRFEAWFRNLADLNMAKQMLVDDISFLQRNFSILTSEDSFANQTTVEFSSDGAVVVGE